MTTPKQRKDGPANTLTLKIGDYVTFRTAKSDAFLSAEGILLEDLFVAPTLTSLNDALFCVHLPRQYSASRELEEYESQLKHLEESGEGPDRKDKNVANFLNALSRGRDNEQKLNNRYMVQKRGQAVKFGDVIQLFHVKSGKYLTIKPNELANTERENIKVSLSGLGSMYSALVVMPRFKIDREGDAVSDGTDLFLTISERRNEFLHCADRESTSGSLPEINCSLEPTPWKMSIFQSAEDAKDPALILSSELIYIIDPEINSALMPAKAQEEEERSEDGGTAVVGDDDEDEGGEEDDGAIRAQEREDEDEDGGEGSGAGSQQGSGAGPQDQGHRLVLKEMDSQGHIDTRMLWLLEFRSKTQGGPIFWRNAQVRIKSLTSGCYLTVSAFQRYDDDNKIVTDFVVGTTSDASDEGSMFSLNEVTGTSKLLTVGKAYNIRSESGGYLERGDEDPVIRSAHMLRASKEKLNASNFQVMKFTTPGQGQEDDIKQREPLDVYVAMATRDYLEKYLAMTVLPKVSHSNTLWPTADRSDLDIFLAVIRRSIIFSQGFPISATNVQLGVDKSDLALAKSRQRNLREQRILDVLLSLIEILVPLSVRADEIAALPRSQQPTLSIEEVAVNKMGNLLLENSLNLLYYCILDNPENQMHVADNIRTLLAHLGSQPLAGKCVTEMLSKNKELQETKIGDEEIEIFVRKLRSSKMNAMYLQLLKACCSCEGDGVDGNQCRVTEHLFHNTNDIIIHIHADYTKIAPIDWKPNGLYLPEAPVAGSPVTGEHLYLSGLPQLSLSWTTNSIDYSPLGLFGKLSVNVQDLYRIVSSSSMGGLATSGKSAQAMALVAKKNQSAQQREAVANYFVGQILLFAEMAMDRNYVAMHAIDELFSYEVLVTILKLDVQDQLKAAAARLVRCLHVDRDPQAESKIPVLTRVWSSVVKQNEIKLPFVGEQRKYVFGLLQQILSDYIASMAGTSWTTLSKSMLELYSTLINFNFYGTPERMEDVINPLIRAVDRRLVYYPGDTDYVEPKKGGLDNTMGSPTVVVNMSGDEEAKEEDPDATREEVLGNGENEESKTEEVPWQQNLYEVTESIPYLLSVLGLVLAAVAVTLWQIVDGDDVDDSPSSTVGIWGLLVLILFIMDVTMRSYAYHFMFKKIVPFFASVYNQIDLLVIAIDIIFLSIPANTGNNSSLTKTLRLVRMVRLLRLFRVAKIVQAVVETLTVLDVDSFKMPLRYSKAPIFELDAMVEIINILLYASRVIDDRNLSIFLRKFHDWESGHDKRNPEAIFESVIEEGRLLTLGVPDMDKIFLDCIMFIHTALVQGALDVIMFHHSTRQKLLDNASKVQLLVSGKRERQFHQIQSMLSTLEQNAETHELWGELQNDAHYAVNKQTKDILKELAELCSARRITLDMFQGNRMPDVAIQNLYSNLGFYPIALKVLDLFEGVEPEEDGTYSEVALNTRDLCLLCNDVLYWFAMDNEHNQEQLYESLDFFLGSLDGQINSHLVVKAIFSNSEKLMKLVPHSYLSDMIEKILKHGRSHHYLTLLQSITNVGPRNIVENQFEIVRVLTQGGRFNKMGIYFVPRLDKKYSVKVQQMEQCKGLKDPSTEELTPNLAYYITLLDILSGCVTGRSAASSMEAKIQSIYNFIDAIECVLDVRSLLVVKLMNLKFLFNCVIDVSLPVPGLVESTAMWKLINLIADKLGKATDYMRKVQELGWEHIEVSRQEAEFVVMGVMTIAVFYEKYYNKELFAHEIAVSGDDRVHMTQSMADQLINNLFTRIRNMYNLDSPRFGEDVKTWLKRALVILNRSATYIIVEDLDTVLNTSSEVFVAAGIGSDESTEQVVHRKYSEFIQTLKDSPSVQKSAGDENVEFITVLESLPYVADKVVSELRYELLIKKVVRHVRENMTIIDNETRLDNRVTVTTKWLITSFRSMIENKMGMSIYERDADGGEEEDVASDQVKVALNTCGATALCLDLIVDGVDPQLQNECIKLLVGLLFLEGGNRKVQSLMHEYLSRPQAFLFFKQVASILEELTAWHVWQGDVSLEEGKEPDDILPENILIVRMLQLMSEGHFGPNQDIMREQPESLEPVNLLESFVVYLKELSHHPCRTSTAAAIRLASTIVEVLQGPCSGNQEFLALNTDVLETCNRMLRAKAIKDCKVEEELELKSTVVALLQGILEGQNMHGAIFERVLSVMHVDVIAAIALEDGDPEETACEEYPSFKTNCLVLLNMLVESRPSIKKEFNIPDDLKASSGGDDIGSVEIFWNDEMHRRYFHIPEVCKLLAKASKDQLVEENNRESQELKLTDFLERSHGLYAEVKHQELLVNLGLNAIYSRRNQEITTWFSFTLAVVINFLYLAYYSWDSSPTDDPENATIGYPDEIVSAVNALNYLQIISSFFTLSSMFVVRLPVVYKTFRDEGMDLMRAAMWTALDAKMLYYVWYFTFSVLGAAVNDQFVTFLLLDLIMKNSTAQNVLNAIVVPIKNILWALVVVEIVNYIFSFQLFNNFAYDFGVDDGQFPFGLDYCYTLFNCLKFTVDYGMRLGGGIGDAFRHTYGKRWLMDTMYFFAIIICVFNLVAGVVITTFGKLREEKNERTRDTEEVCFICGIDKQVFDRSANDPNGFKIHIRDDHNMWSYICFIFYIWEQDKDDDDGLEYYVRAKIEATDIEWLPMNKAMRLEQAASLDEQMRVEFKERLNQSKGLINSRMKKMQTNIVTVLEQLNLALKKDHVAVGADEDDGIGGFFSSSVSRGGTAVGDDFSVVSLGTYASRVILPRRITLLVMDVYGLRLPGNQMDTVYVRVECEEGSYSCPAETVDLSVGRVVLQADKLLVASEATANDPRSVHIVVCARNRADIEIILATLDISLIELMECDGLQSEKIFMSGEDVCSITLQSNASLIE